MDTRYNLEEGEQVAQELLTLVSPSAQGATVVGLSGDLGSGKTTLVQHIAKLLGIAEPVLSPTFVIAKKYQTPLGDFDTLVHIDAYRIDSIDELQPLGWEALLRQPRTLVVVDWPEKVESALPDNAKRFTIEHDDTYRIIRNA